MFFYLRNPDESIRALERRFQAVKDYPSFKKLYQVQIRQGISPSEAVDPLIRLDEQRLSHLLESLGYRRAAINDDRYAIKIERESKPELSHFITIVSDLANYMSHSFMIGRIHNYTMQIRIIYAVMPAGGDPFIKIESPYDLSHHQYQDWKLRLADTFPYQLILPDKIVEERRAWEERRDRIRKRWGKTNPPTQ